MRLCDSPLSKVFQGPLQVQAQRWLPTTHPDYDHSCDTDARSAFRPFSIGSRNCIGQAMAYVVLRIMVAKLCWKLDWELVNRNDVDWDRDLRVYMVWQKPSVRVRLASFAGQDR